MKIAIINESYPVYNLATHKMLVKFKREGHEVQFSPRVDMWARIADKVYLSAVFTYDLPKLVQDTQNLLLAKKYDNQNLTIEIGGPAVTAMPQYIEERTGIKPHIGLDDRFEHVEGKFYTTFTSRGCPRNCPFCLVTKLEGARIVEYPSFNIPVGKNPHVADNNILLTSWEHQQLVVEKLKDVRNLDLNSGFDDRIFSRDPEKYYQLYRKLHLECWRFAYDVPEQKEHIKLCAEFLHSKKVDYRHIIVFCLVGGPGQTFEESRAKLQFLIDIGVSPYPQRFRPLDSVERTYNPPGWRQGDLELLFQYYGVPFVWRSCKWEEFRKRPELWKKGGEFWK